MGFLQSLHQIPFLLSFFLNFLLISTFSSPSSQNLCLHEESVALLRFKSSFSTKISASSDYCNNPQPKTESWKEGRDCCSWDGVSCDNVTGHVIGLDLSCSFLFGSFPSNSTIFLLSQLRQLSLSWNDFNGSKIPSEIGGFSSLTHLSLSFSGFSGQVPKEISHLSHLISLDLSSDSYSQGALKLEPITLRRVIQNFSHISELFLDEIDMSTVELNYFMNLSSSLTSLSLNDCELRGKFPKTILFFQGLKMLSLGGNQNLIVDLPRSNWSSPLQYLSLGGINLSRDEFLKAFKELQSLEKFYLFKCNLKGLFPFSILNLTQLVELDLSNNYFSGPIPSHVVISKLSKLTTLDLSGNLFNGLLPSWLFSLPSLKSLYLHSNQLTSLPKDFPQSSIVSLFLRNNSLQGPIPSSIFNLVNLTYLQLSSNKFSGMLNFDGFLKLKNLQVLDLSNNSFVGNIDQLPGTLVYLNLESNFLQGVLPIPPSHSCFFSVSRNNFTGEIPSLVCNARFLEILVLSHNQLSGKIPSCFCNLSKSLSVLDLQANNFHGSIPSTLPEGCQLKNFVLRENQLKGQLPQSLVNCKGLEVLDVSNNNIEDTFPYWLETLSNLQVLDLKSNNFHGSLQNSHSNLSFPKLRILDLSNNYFCGTLPTWLFESLKAIMKFEDRSSLQYMSVKTSAVAYCHYSAFLVMKGFTFEFQRTSNIFMSIDFSNNKFEGEISEMIGKLRSLKGLNFSYNNLSGYIPLSMRKLTNLEWLDLSSNQLIGIIPQELVDLTQLAVMNLSCNHLVGRIPRGNQFNTFENTSYEGNLGLCGLPLSRSCIGDDKPKPSMPTQMLKDNSDSIFGFGWKVVTIGYGCGLIFGLGIGYLVFKSGKPKWFVTWIDGTGHKKTRRRVEIKQL